MKIFAAFTLTLLLFGCTSQEGENSSYQSGTVESKSQQGTDNFTVEFELEEIGLNTYNLVTTIDPGEGNYVISPFSSDDVYLHFEVSIDENESLLVDGMTSEYPQSEEENDSIINQNVRLVKEKTKYLKHIETNSKSDFEVQGKVQFLLEPICIPYNIEFVIEQKNEEINVRKTNTSIDPSYKK